MLYLQLAELGHAFKGIVLNCGDAIPRKVPEEREMKTRMKIDIVPTDSLLSNTGHETQICATLKIHSQDQNEIGQTYVQMANSERFDLQSY